MLARATCHHPTPVPADDDDSRRNLGELAAAEQAVLIAAESDGEDGAHFDASQNSSPVRIASRKSSTRYSATLSRSDLLNSSCHGVDIEPWRRL